jgi:hypothetical protein
MLPHPKASAIDAARHLSLFKQASKKGLTNVLIVHMRQASRTLKPFYSKGTSTLNLRS